MKKYEYMMEELIRSGPVGQVKSKLDELGALGWQLCCTVESITSYQVHIDQG